MPEAIDTDAIDPAVLDPRLLDAAHAWLTDDPDPDTRDELAALLDAVAAGDAAARASLEERFAGSLEFGTAGLRAALGAGPMRMNAAVVVRAAAGLAAYLRARPGGAGLVVVGYDARHKSDLFARETASVLVGAGLEAVVMPRPLPTPVTAFAIHELGADAGVVVTASHNPPQDNGYKVYVGPSQIVPPQDAEISAAIAAVSSVSSVPRPDDGWNTLDEGIVDAYVARVTSVLDLSTPRDVRIVYTPLHGVGGAVVRRAFAEAGFRDLTTVPSQAAPDADFPTVAFPNPEEPGAMDASYAVANETEADLVLANDPDADRCAVAVPDRDRPQGWRMLRGDEVGALLGEHLVRRHPDLAGQGGTFATTVVSSSLLGKIAAAHGLAYAETLTGFKWLTKVPDLRYAYEEALGYCVDPAGVTDKDGISAALLVAELTAIEKAAGRTLIDVLDDLAVTYGLHATDQLAVRVDDLSLIHEAMGRLGAAPPAALGGRNLERMDDLSLGSSGPAGLPPTDGYRLHLAHGARVIVRPSGTEPKLKAYLEVVLPVADLAEIPAVRARAAADLAAIRSDLAAALGLRDST